jgi:hypothetical protein
MGLVNFSNQHGMLKHVKKRKNKYYYRSHISEKKFRKLIRCFSHDFDLCIKKEEETSSSLSVNEYKSIWLIWKGESIEFVLSWAAYPLKLRLAVTIRRFFYMLDFCFFS